MINTFFGMNSISSASAMFASIILGFFFGIVLERGGFGDSRRITGVFYFTDLTVFKTMFTALVTGMLGLILVEGMGLIDPVTQFYYMPTYYGAFIIAGLIFGVGFVMGGWCPGTAMVGIASGKLDAAFFLGGGILGSIIFNELFPIIKSLYYWGESSQAGLGQTGVAFIYKTLHMGKTTFALLLSIGAIIFFKAVEMIEEAKGRDSEEIKKDRVKWLKPVIIASAILFWLAPSSMWEHGNSELSRPGSAGNLLETIENAEDHIEPEDLADMILRGDPGILLVDVRTPAEYMNFHISGAINASLPDLPAALDNNKSKTMIILYSNGMTHPAQARDVLERMGYRNLYLLTDGLTGFIDRCLKPVSLRDEPLSVEMAARVNAWRNFFYSSPAAEEEITDLVDVPEGVPGLVETGWLADNMGKSGLRILDCREQADYNKGHIQGAYSVSVEGFRGNFRGVPSMLLSSGELAVKFSLLNFNPDDIVVIAYGSDKIRDATLIAMTLEKMGHERYAILNGGTGKWVAEGRPLVTDLPGDGVSEYPDNKTADDFTVDYRQVEYYSRTGKAVIIDARPADYYSGLKSDEARAGHIPGAVNHAYSLDINSMGEYGVFKPAGELEAVYGSIIKSKGTPVVVHCRTGHQASQLFFVLKRLLGYKKVYWYDAGWTEWATRKDLPVSIN